MSRNGGGGEVANLTLGFIVEFDNGILISSNFNKDFIILIILNKCREV